MTFFVSVGLDYEQLYLEAIDLWIKDQDKWMASIANFKAELQNATICVVEETNIKKSRKLYVATWYTNYGERVALIWAANIDEARVLVLETGAWPGYQLDELDVVMPQESSVIFVKGGE